MGRILSLVLLTTAFVAGGTATADTTAPARVPHTESRGHQGGEAGVTHVVVPGESLWRISEQHVEPVGGMGVGAYWREVVEVNRDSIRSGDPDLIFPGEEIQLPPISGRQ